jgi:hypothetical protein
MAFWSSTLPALLREDTDDFDYYMEIAREATRDVEITQEREDKLDRLMSTPRTANKR